MEEEAENFIVRCDKCQRYANNMHRPAELLHSVISPWPFMKWGMDMVGHLPQAKGKVRFLFILTNYFSKWVEAGKCPEVLPGVLWAYRTTTKISTGETPFSVVYGTEALIPVEIGEPSMRYTHTSEETNEEELRVNLDLTEERREATLIRMTAQKQMIEQYYNKKANLSYFKIGDFVLRKVFRSTKTANAGKLGPNWEDPYRVRGISGKEAYELETMDGKVLPSNGNEVHLKKYYF
ncbi:uncharacterized protein [Nicotiana tomentosiformis]|uniref:uncharacterized protein n=1 Tax=Nicotiana tomentosiformis TaxID=4098 RepID=UPI00388C689C